MLKTRTVSLNSVLGLCLVKYAPQEALNSLLRSADCPPALINCTDCSCGAPKSVS